MPTTRRRRRPQADQRGVPSRGGDGAAPPEYEHIGVVLRLRPLVGWERSRGADVAVTKHGDHALKVDRGDGAEPRLARCDRAFDASCDQARFFRASGIVPLLDAALDGFRATAFAYGQTGAGKTRARRAGSSFDESAAAPRPRRRGSAVERRDAATL